MTTAMIAARDGISAVQRIADSFIYCDLAIIGG
jgi:hypothetical protein